MRTVEVCEQPAGPDDEQRAESPFEVHELGDLVASALDARG